MEFTEINVPEGILQQNDHKGPFADIIVDVRNGNNIYSNINHDMSYEDTLGVEEINMERARYLLNTDEILEEMLGQTHG